MAGEKMWAGLLTGHAKELGICSHCNKEPIEILRREAKESDLYFKKVPLTALENGWRRAGVGHHSR